VPPKKVFRARAIISTPITLRKTNVRIIIHRVSKLKWNLLLLLVALVGGAWIHASRVPNEDEVAAKVAARVNFQAPDFALTTLDGTSIVLSEQRGKIVLINFWATWCPPCRAEMPEINAAAQAHRDQLMVLAINNGETIEQVRPFVAEFQLTFPVLLDPDGAVASKYAVLGLPTSFFVDRNGIVRAANIGAMNRAYIEAQIAALTK